MFQQSCVVGAFKAILLCFQGCRDDLSRGKSLRRLDLIQGGPVRRVQDVRVRTADLAGAGSRDPGYAGPAFPDGTDDPGDQLTVRETAGPVVDQDRIVRIR